PRVHSATFADFTALLLQRFNPANGENSCAAGLLRNHAAFDVQLCLTVEVIAQLGIEFVLHLASIEKKAKNRFEVHAQLLDSADNAADGSGQTNPVFALDTKLISPALRQLVVSRLAVVLRCFPACLDPTLFLQAMQRRVKRTLVDLEHAFGYLLNP